MKSWMKVLIGLGAGAAVGGAAAFFGKKHEAEDDDYVEDYEDTNYESDSNEEDE